MMSSAIKRDSSRLRLYLLLSVTQPCGTTKIVIPPIPGFVGLAPGAGTAGTSLSKKKPKGAKDARMGNARNAGQGSTRLPLPS